MVLLLPCRPLPAIIVALRTARSGRVDRGVVGCSRWCTHATSVVAGLVGASMPNVRCGVWQGGKQLHARVIKVVPRHEEDSFRVR